MKAYFTYFRILYLILAFFIGALYTLLFLKKPLDGMIVLFFSLVYAWGCFSIFSYFSSLFLKSVFKNTNQDTYVVNTFLPANILFTLLLYITIATSLNDYMDPRGERSLMWLSIIILPFFTSLIGGILSACLILIKGWDSRKIIVYETIGSCFAVLLFFIYLIASK